MRSGITRLLLVGNGPGHLTVLDRLARQHPGDLQVSLLTPWAHHTPADVLPALIAGQIDTTQARVDLSARLQAAHARWLPGRCVALDAEARSLRYQPADGSPAQSLGYDLLSIDTATAVDRERLAQRWPGAREHALALWPGDDFLRLWPEVVALAQRRPVSLVVIGAGSAAVEAAFAAAERLRRDGAAGSTFTLVTGGPEPAMALPAGARAHLRQRLRRAGIQVLCEPCTAIGPNGVRLGNGGLLRCDVPLIAEHGDAPAWLAGSGLVCSESGHALVNRFLQSTSHAHVFATGEAAERDDHPHPRNAAQAWRAAPVLAHNLLAAHEGQAFKPHWPAHHTRTWVACGSAHALVAWGPWWARGAWVRWWKSRVDRRWMQPATRSIEADTPQPGDVGHGA